MTGAIYIYIYIYMCVCVYYILADSLVCHLICGVGSPEMPPPSDFDKWSTSVPTLWTGKFFYQLAFCIPLHILNTLKTSMFVGFEKQHPLPLLMFVTFDTRRARSQRLTTCCILFYIRRSGYLFSTGWKNTPNTLPRYPTTRAPSGEGILGMVFKTCLARIPYAS